MGGAAADGDLRGARDGEHDGLEVALKVYRTGEELPRALRERPPGSAEMPINHALPDCTPPLQRRLVQPYS